LAALAMMWAGGLRSYPIKLPWLQVAKTAFISTMAALTAHFVALHLSPVGAVLCGGVSSLIVLFSLLYFMRVLEPEDFLRFRILARMLPSSLVAPAIKLLAILTHLQPETPAPSQA
jgi:hypothetical protein